MLEGLLYYYNMFTRIYFILASHCAVIRVTINKNKNY